MGDYFENYSQARQSVCYGTDRAPCDSVLHDQEILDGMNSKRDSYIQELEAAIADEKNTEEEVGVLKDVFDVHMVSDSPKEEITIGIFPKSV